MPILGLACHCGGTKRRLYFPASSAVSLLNKQRPVLSNPYKSSRVLRFPLLWTYWREVSLYALPPQQKS